MTPHTALTNEALLLLGSQPDVLAWKNSTGAARAIENPKRLIEFGLVGSGDIIAIVAPLGHVILFECKTGTGRLSTEQRNFRAALEAVGGTYVKTCSLDDVREALAIARRRSP